LRRGPISKGSIAPSDVIVFWRWFCRAQRASTGHRQPRYAFQQVPIVGPIRLLAFDDFLQMTESGKFGTSVVVHPNVSWMFPTRIKQLIEHVTEKGFGLLPRPLTMPEVNLQ
jgi:hypothetical protein